MDTIDRAKIIDKFIGPEKNVSGGSPHFVLVLGPIGAGKTTIRRNNFSVGFVHLDASEIFAQLTEGHYKEFPGDLEGPLVLIGHQIAQKAVNEKRNIICEFIGESEPQVTLLIEALKSAGYLVQVEFVGCDVKVSYERHLKAVAEDETYISSFFTQKYHYEWLLKALNPLNPKLTPSN